MRGSDGLFEARYNEKKKPVPFPARITITLTDFVLHPGLPKSATSTLQRALFCNHSELHYLGKRKDSAAEKGCASDEIYELLKPVLWQGKQFDPEISRTRYRELVIERANPEHSVVASWEALGQIKPERFAAMLSRVEQTVGRPRVIFGLRNPLSRIPSGYLQQLQGHFVRGNRRAFANSPYLDIQQWLDKQVQTNNRDRFWTNYLSNIRTAVHELGAESVGILIFEQLRNSPIDFYTTVADFMRIGLEETRTLCEGAHFNLRITQAEIDYAKQVNASVVRRKLWRMQSPAQRRKALNKVKQASTDDGASVKIPLPDEWVARIKKDTAEGHRWLQDTFAIDLAVHGYPV